MKYQNKMLEDRDKKMLKVFRQQLKIANQMGLDAAVFAANDVLGLGSGRAGKFCKSYIEYMNKMAGMNMENSKDDKNIEYSRAQIDSRLKSIIGEENFAPWDERYK